MTKRKRSAFIFIDGENFKYKVEESLMSIGKSPKSGFYTKLHFRELLSKILKDFPDIEMGGITYYSAKLHLNKEMLRKSKQLIDYQRRLFNSLRAQNIEIKTDGHVRSNVLADGSIVFKEKGVDVSIAVDIVSCACDKTHDVIILCSSDSDLQPAVKEAQKRGLLVYYVGFEINQNKGLKYTCDKSIFISRKDIEEAIK